MALETLYASQFRNLAIDQPLVLHPKVNIFIGGNGSGKSSLLETIYLLSHGKSFRTSKIDQLVSNDASQFVVSVKDEKAFRLGMSRDGITKASELRANGQTIRKMSEFAKLLAVQIVTPESFRLFFGGPKERRRFVDLGLFHVKHSFNNLWREFNIAAKQRNACLKRIQDIDTLAYWNSQFCQFAEQLSSERAKYVSCLNDALEKWLKLLLPQVSNVTAEYYQGWPKNKDLLDLLVDNVERDRKLGFTSIGAHKFDLRFMVNRVTIENALSRGQQKLFLLALTLAQTEVLAEELELKPLLLIDDFGAELDDNSRKVLAMALSQLDCQIMITAIEYQMITDVIEYNKNFKLFHVKHGKITEESNRL